MPATVVLVVEGVLRAHVGDRPLPAGMLLYHGLSSIGHVALVSNDDDAEWTSRWLRTNGFSNHNYLITADPAVEPRQRRLAQISKLREAGHQIEFIVEPDPAEAAVLLANGISAMVMTHPRYSKPEHRPDYNDDIKPWADFVSEIERQQALRSSDPRIDSD
jgi:hypothetical protein